MSTATTNLNETEIQADLKAVLASLSGGEPLDPETVHRIRERAEKITEEIRQQQGILNVAVDLIREIRDES
jgi:predicted thioredoxin/glutaredoxin